MIVKIDIPAEILHILQKLEANGWEAYIVGECVRDSLLGSEPVYWDIRTSAGLEEIEALFPVNEVILAGFKSKMVKIVTGETSYAVIGFRRHSGNMDDGEKKWEILEDLKHWDFNINAVAYSLQHGLVDPFNGLEDLRCKRISCPAHAHYGFQEDGMRILRAIGLAIKLGFKIDKDILQAALSHRELLTKSSADQIRCELLKMFSYNVKNLICQLEDAQPIFEIIIPEIKPMIGFMQNNPYHVYDVWHHTLEALRTADDDLIVRLTVFFHDIGKPHCYTEDENGIGHFHGHGIVSAEITNDILMRLNFDDDTRVKIVQLARYHDGILRENRKSIEKWLNRIGEEQLRRLLKIRTCDIVGQNPHHISERVAKVERITAMLEEVIAQEDFWVTS